MADYNREYFELLRRIRKLKAKVAEMRNQREKECFIGRVRRIEIFLDARYAEGRNLGLVENEIENAEKEIREAAY